MDSYREHSEKGCSGGTKAMVSYREQSKKGEVTVRKLWVHTVSKRKKVKWRYESDGFIP